MPAGDSFLVKCLACGATNRVAEEQEAKQGKCGSCGVLLLPVYAHPQPLDDRSFDLFMGEYGGPVLAEFWAPW